MMSSDIKVLLFIYVSFLVLIYCSESAEKNNEACKNVAALKGLVHMVESVSASLMDIVSSARYRAKTLEANMCISPRIDLTNVTTEATDDSDHCVHAEPDCKALYNLGFKEDGPYRIWPSFLNHSIIVYCDMTTDGGGWTVIQRRGTFEGEEHVNFFRNWADYKNGFGDVRKEFWIGNDIIFALTNEGRSVLRFDLEDFENDRRFAKYSNFLVRSEVEKYLLSFGEYEGNSGDSFRQHDGMHFHTKDRGNHCPNEFKGAWWYKACHEVNLNGQYLKGNHSTFADGINWLHFRGFHYSLSRTEMKVRRCDC